MAYKSKDGALVYEDSDYESKKNPTNYEEYIPPYGPIENAPDDVIKGMETSKKNPTNYEEYIPPYGPIENAPDDVIKGMEAAEIQKRKADAPKKAILKDIIREFPKTSNELLEKLELTDYRLDLMKELVETSKEQFFEVADKYKSDFTKEANEIVNNKLTNYLCLIETLKTSGNYNFGSEFDSQIKNYKYYDPYKPNLMLNEIMLVMNKRRKNGANINIVFPVNYDLTNIESQITCDAITVTYNVDQHIQNNMYMGLLWKKAGYQESESKNFKAK